MKIIGYYTTSCIFLLFCLLLSIDYDALIVYPYWLYLIIRFWNIFGSKHMFNCFPATFAEEIFQIILQCFANTLHVRMWQPTRLSKMIMLIKVTSLFMYYYYYCETFWSTLECFGKFLTRSLSRKWSLAMSSLLPNILSFTVSRKGTAHFCGAVVEILFSRVM